jgi:hypothetical protein
VQGSVSVPHGLQDANVSRLTRAHRGEVDPLTGMIVQSGIPVTISSEEIPESARGDFPRR